MPQSWPVERLEPRTLLAAVVLRETVTDFGESEFADDVLAQRDGRVIVLGHTDDTAGGRLFLTRYDIDGTVDSFFGENGRIFGDFASFRRASSMAVDRLGRIVIAGTTTGPEAAIALMRFTRSGFLDRSFGDNGLATLQAGSAEIVSDVAVDSTGRVVVVGQTLVTTSTPQAARPGFLVARFDALGRPDVTFGGGDNFSLGTGVSVFPIGLGESGATSVAIDRNNILVGGFATEQSSGQSAERRFALARLERFGSLNDDFGPGGDGIVTLNVGLPGVVQDIALARGGKIVLAGNTLPAVNSPGEQILVARLDRGGRLDSSFGGGDGFTLSAFGGARAQLARSVAVDRSGRVLVAGIIADGGDPAGDLDDDRFLLARYLSDGTPDTTFAPGGALINEVQPGANSFEEVAGVAIQREGRDARVVVAGNAGTSLADQDLVLLRVATDATIGTGSARLNGSKLVVKGTVRNDAITVSPNFGAGTIEVVVNGTLQSFPAAAVRRIEVGAKDGDDEVTCSVGSEVVTVLLGGDGDDDLRLLGDARGRLEGGDGHDDLGGGIQADRLRGGRGDDLLFGGDGNDDLDGDSGFDRLFGEDGDDDLKADDGFPDDLDGGPGDDDARIDLLDFFTRIDDVEFR